LKARDDRKRRLAFQLVTRIHLYHRVGPNLKHAKILTSAVPQNWLPHRMQLPG